MRNSIFFCFVLATLLLLLYSCTPKTTETVTQTEPKPKITVPKEGASPCVKWTDMPNMEGLKTSHVLYRDFMKQKQYDEAMPYWEKVYNSAPAADGFRDYHFLDGVKFQEYMLAKETDPAKKKQFEDRIFELYQEATDCYPKRANLYKGLAAFKTYYSYPDRASQAEQYGMFKEVVDMDKGETADFIVNPFTALLMEQITTNSISTAEGQKYAQLIFEIVEYGTKNCKNTKDCARWDLVKDYSPARLEELEGIENFYPCSYYQEKYTKVYNSNPTDCETIGSVYSILKWGKCPSSDPLLIKLKPEVDRCFPPEADDPVTTAGPSCASSLREGRYVEAIDCYEGKAVGNADSERAASYYLTIAKIYYAHLKKFSSSRKYARKALELKPGWGKAHILIGKLYASSGPLCGPGRGFDSQVVTWVAIDEWNKAKKDPETAAEAQTLTSKYHQYMPSKEDIFQRSINEGDSYTVKCWINQSTKVRVP